MDGGNLVKHYRNAKIQPDDAIEQWGLNFRLGNIIKYTVRCNLKGSKETDLIKVVWYAVKELTDSTAEADAAVARIANYLDIDLGQPSDRTES